MRKDGKYRFTLQFGADSEDQIRVGELLEKLGNRKSMIIVSALSDYINAHPELQSGYNRRKKHNCFNISIQIAEPLASVLYSRMKRLYHTEVWYGRFLLYPLEGGESDVLIAVIIIVTTNHYFIHSMPSWHVAYIAENRAVKRYGFSLLWWHAPRRHENGPQTGISRTG